MVDRIQLILKSKNLSSSQFADEIQVQRSSVSHILTGRNKPSLDFISKILTSYPEINSDWLLFGKGQMIKKTESEKNILQKPIPSTNDNKSPILENSGEINFNEEIPENIKTRNKLPEAKAEMKIRTNPSKIEKIIVFYEDKSFEEFTS
jgi:transcriptional regulator with XRE-family HTH domain